MTTPTSDQPEWGRRRSYAIVSHPDAGKTTLTENLLLSAGAIRLAGQVRARGENRRTQSDWMKIEQERGISVSASVMTYEHRALLFNLLDTPGHEDFSEDTYRTLTAADSAIMVLDAAKGVEPRTLKLIEVCRLRDIPRHLAVEVRVPELHRSAGNGSGERCCRFSLYIWHIYSVPGMYHGSTCTHPGGQARYLGPVLKSTRSVTSHGKNK